MNDEKPENHIVDQKTLPHEETPKEVETRIEQKQKSTIVSIQKVKTHFEEWKWFYGILIIILSSAVSSLSLICSAWSGWEARKATRISQQALEITRQSVEMQAKEFKLRNRPVIVIKNFALTGVVKASNGIKLNHAVTYRIINQSETPATRVEGVARIVDSKYALAPTVTKPAALAKEDEFAQQVFLSDEAYSEVTNSVKKVMIEIEVTYAGMLGEADNEYRTFSRIYYSDVDQTFRVDKSEYR